jgi:DNA repair photolyase
MAQRPPPEGFKGRGALSNPRNRFARHSTEAVDDGWHHEPEPEQIATELILDASRTIIARNDSPDIPYDQSINPYRGCEHGCVFCLSGETPILMADGGVRPLQQLQVGDEIIGTTRDGWYRRFTRTRVLAHWSVIKPAWRITLQDDTVLLAGADHRFLTDRGWKFVTGAQQGANRRPHLTTGSKLMGVGGLPDFPTHDAGYRTGYLAGSIRSDGMIRECSCPDHTGIGGENQSQCRLALCDPMQVVRMTGGLKEHLRFFMAVVPAISRKRGIAGQRLKSSAKLGVRSIEPVAGAMRLYDITTGTEDFIANGVVSHNCYARPTHAYLNLSPGLDFETKLLYKPDAARLLREELGRPGYRCRLIMLGSNTDPYQPVERKLGITRSILEVLEETGHPVSITTRSTLVLRDLDLLARMAGKRLTSVQVSITTFDSDLKRGLEPRSASSLARLQVIRELSAAGVPVTVMAAPVIPAVNDGELETILERAAEAGARRAQYTLLRLPLEVKDLFREWLAQHLPDRAAHVMSLIQDARGGRDNDARFGARMKGQGAWAQLLSDRFRLACRRLGLNARREPDLDETLFRPPNDAPQLELGL